MSDERLRAAERRAAHAGPEAQAALLRERARAGDREAHEELVLLAFEERLRGLDDPLERWDVIDAAGRAAGFEPAPQSKMHRRGHCVNLNLIGCTCNHLPWSEGDNRCTVFVAIEGGASAPAALTWSQGRPPYAGGTLPWPDAFRHVLRNCPTRPR